MAESTFEGFPTEGIDFLRALPQNNNREWFEAHKDDYNRYLREPALALIVTVGERLKAISGGIIYDTRTNGSGSLMRIYRDTRFSEDKTPYKTHLDIMWWEGEGRRADNPGLGFRVTGSETALYAGMHGFDKPLLAAYREAVADETHGPALAEIVTALRADGYTLNDAHYKRVPRGYPADHPRADLLRQAALYVTRYDSDVDRATRPELVEYIVDHFQRMAPLHKWLVALRKSMA